MSSDKKNESDSDKLQSVFTLNTTERLNVIGDAHQMMISSYVNPSFSSQWLTLFSSWKERQFILKKRTDLNLLSSLSFYLFMFTHCLSIESLKALNSKNKRNTKCCYGEAAWWP